MWGRVSLAAWALDSQLERVGLNPTCALSRALYHTCFICGQRCKRWFRQPKLTPSVISDVKSIIYIFIFYIWTCDLILSVYNTGLVLCLTLKCTALVSNFFTSWGQFGPLTKYKTICDNIVSQCIAWKSLQLQWVTQFDPISHIIAPLCFLLFLIVEYCHTLFNMESRCHYITHRCRNHHLCTCFHSHSGCRSWHRHTRSSYHHMLWNRNS